MDVGCVIFGMTPKKNQKDMRGITVVITHFWVTPKFFFFFQITFLFLKKKKTVPF